jgi:hypothetical protein
MKRTHLAPPRSCEWNLARDGAPLPCGYCKKVPVDVHMADHDGRALTSRSCRCSRQWLDGDRIVGLAHVLALLPKRREGAARASGV